MDLVVVSNRVARAKANEPMTGGLAAALLPVVEKSGAILSKETLGRLCSIWPARLAMIITMKNGRENV